MSLSGGARSSGDRAVDPFGTPGDLAHRGSELRIGLKGPHRGPGTGLNRRRITTNWNGAYQGHMDGHLLVDAMLSRLDRDPVKITRQAGGGRDPIER